jgi:DNA modification methylase
VQLLLTDPPYGVAYVGGTGLTIRNDDLDEAGLHQLLEQSLTAAAELMPPGAPFYIFSPSGVLETTFRLALPPALGLRQQLVWVKDSLVLGHSDYQMRHETILYGWRPGAGEPDEAAYEPAHDTVLYGWKTGGAHAWDGDRRQSTVWEFPRPRRSSEHPTMKPVAMLEAAIGNSTRPGAHVLDLFAGSGSTLIACHGTKRAASLVELDPAYADVICRRYQEHTGVVPVRDGQPVTFA